MADLCGFQPGRRLTRFCRGIYTRPWSTYHRRVSANRHSKKGSLKSGFGTFNVATRAASEGRNPRTGEAITIPASKQPKFRAGKGLKDAVND